MLAPDSLGEERTIRSNAKSILNHTNVRTKKVAKQFFSREPFTSFKSLQTADEVNHREEIKTTGRLNCSKKNNGTD